MQIKIALAGMLADGSDDCMLLYFVFLMIRITAPGRFGLNGRQCCFFNLPDRAS